MEPDQVAVKSEIERVNTFKHLSKQEIGKESLLSVSSFGENPVQWIQLLDALDYGGSDNISESSGVGKGAEAKKQNLIPWDGLSMFPSTFPQTGMKSKSQQIESIKALESVAAQTNGETEKYLLGWPLLSPYKVQLLKCEKCPREFCSAINHRRHCRGHRRSLKMDKDPSKSRVMLGAYWDKLSLQEASEIVSLRKASIENVSGSSIIDALASSIRKPGFLLLPHVYVKAGSTLVDIVGGTASGFPLSSQDLFSVLDDASERTFLSGADALSLEKYIFGGNAGRIAFELKNLVACTSFLIEQELVKAWLAHKNVEALRCQELLVEEEEAAHRRQADLLERKRLKKLRQREKRGKESANLTKADIKPCFSNTIEATAGLAKNFGPNMQSEHFLSTQETSFSQELKFSDTCRLVEHDKDSSMAVPCHAKDVGENLDPHEFGSQPQHSASGRFLGSTDNCYCNSSSDQTLSDNFSVDIPSCSRKMMDSEECADKRNHKSNKHELLIGSIIIRIEDDDDHKQDTVLIRKKSERQADTNFSLNANNQMAIKPVCHDNADSSTLCENKRPEVNNHSDHAESINQTPSKESCEESCSAVKDDDSDKCRDSSYVLSQISTMPRSFSSHSAEDFLSQRWKEAKAAHHVTAILSSDPEASGSFKSGRQLH